jgi:hypothetical protein
MPTDEINDFGGFFSTRLDMFKTVCSLGGAVLLLAESMSVFSLSVLLLRNNLEKDFPEYSINKIDLYLLKIITLLKQIIKRKI